MRVPRAAGRGQETLEDEADKAHIAFVRLGRSVRYRRADVEQFIAASVVSVSGEGH